jgi:hypothetical protein
LETTSFFKLRLIMILRRPKVGMRRAAMRRVSARSIDETICTGVPDR